MDFQQYTKYLTVENAKMTALAVFALTQVVGLYLLATAYSKGNTLKCDPKGTYEDGCDANASQFRWGVILSLPTLLFAFYLYIVMKSAQATLPIPGPQYSAPNGGPYF